jgi:hypothetical protein
MEFFLLLHVAKQDVHPWCACFFPFLPFTYSWLAKFANHEYIKGLYGRGGTRTHDLTDVNRAL